MREQTNKESVEKTIEKMTLEEKISLCSGADFWNTKEFSDYGIKSVKMSDGPHGLRCQPKEADMLGINESLPATAFPTAVTSGASWDTELIEKEAEAIANEARAAGVSVLLGPGCNIKRNPLGGRNFEYFSEDPYLSGKLAAAFIRGAEKTGVSSTLKHFAANNQEYKRQNGDSILDERTLREIYLTPFEIAVKEGHPGAVMSSYNKINGIHASDDKRLLTDILRDVWGFDGVVITDWGGLSDRIAAFRAGCDLNMPGGSSYMEIEAYNSVIRGELSEDDVDRSVGRIVALAKKAEKLKKCEIDWERHHELAKDIATKGAVLLKNEGNILPLKDKDFVLIGNMTENMRYQGSGSSHINPTRLTSIADAAKDISVIPVGDKFGNLCDEEIKSAKESAASHKAAVVVIGLPDSYESEGFDREHMRLPDGYLRLVDEIAETNPNTVVVLLCGSVVELPFRDKVKAILYMGLSGQAGGEAAIDLLTGKDNPSGKLTESWPVSYNDVVCADTFGKKNTEYREGPFVGYRYYAGANVTVAYPFGHGLSYTGFEYSNISADRTKVIFTVKNIGENYGEEVAQIYASPVEDRLFRPTRWLAGFVKIKLLAGESKTVEIALDDYAFRFWDGEWKIPSGKYKILVGASSEDIRLSETVEVEGDDVLPREELSGSWYDRLIGKPGREEWQALMGRAVPEAKEPKKGEYTMDSTCLEMKDHSLVMKIQYKITENVISKSFGGKKDMSDPAYKMMLTNATDGPMRTVVISSDGMMSEPMARAFLAMANGRFFRGLRELVFPKKRLKNNKKNKEK